MPKLSSKGQQSEPELGDYLGFYRNVGGVLTDYRIDVANLLTGPVRVFDPVVPQGIDGTTTAVLNYGINVVSGADYNNQALKLPPPKKGKTVTVVVTGLWSVRVYPSQVGGSINGQVNGFIVIQPTGLAVPIVCWENPLPGDWSTPMNMQSILTSVDFSIAHVNGAASNYAGNMTQALSSFIGNGTSGNNMTLTPDAPYWFSLPHIAQAVRLRVLSNVKAGDALDNTLNNLIVAARASAFKTSANTATSGQREGIYFGNTGVQTALDPSTVAGVVAGGVQSATPEIGDVDTFFGQVDATPNAGANMGVNPDPAGFSNYYNIFKVHIPASAATKTYKFRFVLEYV